MHKEKKETTHEEIGETVITTSIYIYIHIKNEYKVCYHNIRTMYLKSKENKRLHTINKKQVHKERKETIHEEIGETVITTSIYIST